MYEDEEAEKEAAEKELARKMEQHHEDLRAVAATPFGRRVLGRLADEVLLDTGFDPDSRAAAYNDGLRRYVLDMRLELKWALPRDVYLEIVYPKKEE